MWFSQLVPRSHDTQLSRLPSHLILNLFVLQSSSSVACRQLWELEEQLAHLSKMTDDSFRTPIRTQSESWRSHQSPDGTLMDSKVKGLLKNAPPSVDSDGLLQWTLMDSFSGLWWTCIFEETFELEEAIGAILPVAMTPSVMLVCVCVCVCVCLSLLHVKN